MNLKLLRKQKKHTQEEISKIINTSITCYNYYEKEKREPTIETLCKLADFYNVTLDYLVGREFKNDIGYLTDKQYSAVLLLKQLDNDNLNKEIGRLSALVEMQ